MGQNLFRLLKFSAVGATGLVVHLGLLSLLVHVLGMHYLGATALSVEAAVLHKFIWHRKWTWADRSGSVSSPVSALLWRFHLTTGLVSIGGNTLSAGILTGYGNVDPVLANLVCLLPCWLANFLLSDRLVFVSPRSLQQLHGITAAHRVANGDAI